MVRFPIIRALTSDSVLFPFSMATDCALDADGNLENASDIEFFNSETDSHPIRRHRTNVEPEKRDKLGMCSFFRSNSIHDTDLSLFFPSQ